MKIPFIPFLFIFLALFLPAAVARNTESPVPAPQNHGLLTKAFPDAAAVSAALIPLERWTPFPKIENRTAWEKADAVVVKSCADYAAGEINYAWPSPPATLALLISRTGDRQQYQAVSYKKRIVLANMIIAELAENKGRYIDPIINGVWSICEESWWGSTAHLPRAYKGLMDVTRPRVDLYAGVTAGILAWADYFFAEKFDAASPQIRKRIRHEVRTRVLEPVLAHHHWWMSADPETGERPNNWNPWICSNWLTAALLLEDNAERRATHVARILQVLDNFLTPYPNDGGCDEGPGYWGAAVGAFYDNIALLNLATDGAFNFVFKNDKIRDMGRYIYLAQIGKQYSVNFADAPPCAHPESYITYRYAKDIGDEPMRRFAAACQWNGYHAAGMRSHFTRDLFNAFIATELRNAPAGFTFPREHYFKDLQVAIARERAGDTAGFYFAAKGGTNNESHNHNDIGNVIVYHDGLPVLIDVGPGRYTARTFSAQRYEIWNHRSDYHNTAAPNGVEQQFGGEFRGSNASFLSNDNYAVFSLDIAKAYPPAAGVKRWTRTVTLNRKNTAGSGTGTGTGGVTIRDDYLLERADSIAVHFMTNQPVRVDEPNGRLIFERPAFTSTDPRPLMKISEPPATFALEYDTARVTATIEKIPLTSAEDEGVRASWGDNIRRITLRIKKPALRETFEWHIRTINN